MKKYIPIDIENKWQQRWKEDQLFSVDPDKAKKPYYALMMFPYPSAEGLHVGNMYPFTGTDIFARYQRMRGYDVFEPIGLDGFGIHSENYALKINKHPMDLSKITEKRFYEQLTMIGDSFDWTRTVETYKPSYYKWTQWLFLQMFRNGLAYRKKAEVNWCPSCRTVLSDEQVISGECERCLTAVLKKELEQWFFRITKYADKLLEDLNWIDWSEKVKIMQRNWIGKSEGALIKFKIAEDKAKGKTIEVFTTRPDTIFGATFVVVSPGYPLLKELVSDQQRKEVERYLEKAQATPKVDVLEKEFPRTGVFTGSFVENPLNKEKIPVWVADYVLMEYGTGAIMGVPGHDGRDFEFAENHNLPIQQVILPTKDGHLPYEGEGELVNSGQFNGMESDRARQEIIDYLKKNDLGQKEVHYHLRDWLISRQRYWGPPIPIIYCQSCWEKKTARGEKQAQEGVDYIVREGEKYAIVPVPEADLPVTLPYIENFRPTGTGQSPLASDPDFVNVTCPVCQGNGIRETDVSDTFLDSAWYYLRYPSTEFNDRAFDKKRLEKWLPIDMYIGGAEHSVLHLLYARFVSMALQDLGWVDFEEPFKKFRAHGLIISEGAKMSKSKGNVINPDKYIKEYGADTLRMYLMFMGPFTEGGDFRDSAIGGIYRYLVRVWDLVNNFKVKKASDEELRRLNQTVKRVEEDIENLRFNTAIAALMELLNFLSKQGNASEETIKAYLLLLAPFAPHITEEMWQIKGWPYSIHQQTWPKYEEKWLVETEVIIALTINGKVRDQLVISQDLAAKQAEVEQQALKSPKMKKYLEGQKIKKTIYVPGQILNFVV